MTKPTMWLCAQRRLRSVWASMPFCWFCHEAAHNGDTKDFKVQTSQFIRHSSYFTLHSFLKRYFMYKRQLKVPFQSSQFMDG